MSPRVVDLAALKRTWRYSRSDFAAMLATILVTLAEGVEAGVVAGVALSIALHLYRTSRPHWADTRGPCWRSSVPTASAS